MTISWLGQACVVVKSNDHTLVVDPYSPERIGIPMPSLKADVVAVSHGHADHNNVSAISGKPFTVNEPGEYEVQGFSIETVRSFHDDEQGSKRGDNLIFVISVEDKRLAHFGDFGQGALSSEQIDALNEIDIAFLPVGGFFTIDGIQAAKIVTRLEPKIAIPMHYQIPGLAIKELAGPEQFFETLGMQPERVMETWNVKLSDFPQEGTKVLQLKPMHSK